MFLLTSAPGSPVVYSPTDIARAACPFDLLRELDGVLGRAPRLERVKDPMNERAARLGDAHEARVLADYLDRYGPYDGGTRAGVAVIAEASGSSEAFRANLEPAREATLAALRGGADVVFQGTFFDGRFHGRSDFLLKIAGSDPAPPQRAAGVTATYAVVDTKLTARVRATALLQLAGYADQLLAHGVSVAPQVWIHHGNGERSGHQLADLLEVYRSERRVVQALLDAHVAWGRPVEWEDWRDPAGSPAVLDGLPVGVGVLRRACGRCETCSAEAERTHDVQLLPGIRASQRTRLYGVGVRTVEDLADFTGSPAGVNPQVLARMTVQARAQAGQLARVGGATKAGYAVGPGMRVVTAEGVPLALTDPDSAARWEPLVRAEVVRPTLLRTLPAPDPGDIYFDFEGDPLWTSDGRLEGGLEYLFGLVEEGAGERYVAFWAHDRAQEKAALQDFLHYVAARRARYPGMHIYHYANYEKAALERLAERHGVGLAEVLDLIREGVLVDLLPVVRGGVVASTTSYSLKKLEPLYMGDELRESDVTTGGDSVAEYARAHAARAAGDLPTFEGILTEIADYNRYDCVSTRRLVQWLRERARDGVTAIGGDDRPGRAGAGEERGADEDTVGSPSALAPTGEHRLMAALTARAGDPPRNDDEQAIALLAAAVDFHRREEAPGWREYFERLTHPVDWWADQRDVLCVGEGPGDVEVLEDWQGNARSHARVLRLTGGVGGGSSLTGGDVLALYPVERSGNLRVVPGAAYAATSARLRAATLSPDGTRAVIEVRETANPDFAQGPGRRAFPIAIVPTGPIMAGNPHRAIVAVAEQVAGLTVAGLDALPPGSETPPAQGWLTPSAGLDLLRRRVPRLLGGGALPPVSDGDYIGAITSATAVLTDSYLAVQGPPGTGKTYVGARVVARLVLERGWRIGVVAQSHAVVQNFLDEIVAAGLSGEQVGKRPDVLVPANHPEVAPPPWTQLGAADYSTFLGEHAERGCVIGGTMWDFTNPARVVAGSLDLLVVDEAGQFSLANTLAASTAASRLLLLGDPQQLPQVTQGVHAEPVDTSALAWLLQNEATMPQEYGYFIERTWRMHSVLTEAVSELSYAGRLESQPCTDARHLDGLAPGIHVRSISHRGNSSASREEAEAVVAVIRGLLGRRWRADEGQPTRPLAQRDILVVAPYNAQVALVLTELRAAGLPAVRVGTVDKFQGQEAAVAIVTLAASSARDVPRGMDFLLDRNRLNVAISRAQWAAIVVHSDALADTLPTSGGALADLGAFLRLCARATH